MSDPAPDAPLPIPSEEGPRADANAAWNGPEGAPAEPLEPQQALAQAPGANQADAAPGPAGNPPPSPAPAAALAQPSPGGADLPDPGPGAGAALLQLVLGELQQKRQALEQELAELEGRRDQVRREIQSSFAGQSDGIARRVKGFQDYLVGALQELAVAAEQVELVVQPLVVQPSPLDQEQAAGSPAQARPPRACSARTNP